MRLLYFLAFTFFLITSAQAADAPPLCASGDNTCLFTALQNATKNIDNDRYRDQTLRDMSKLMIHEKNFPAAIDLFHQIKSADTKAMTLRGIGVATAETDFLESDKKNIYTNLIEAAEEITEEDSRVIALRYVAKGQALAGFDDDAHATMRMIDNRSQRDKAFEEIAEVQAKQDKLGEAVKSIAAIESPPYRDRAYGAISKIFVHKENYESAIKTAQMIETPYNRAQALLLILTAQITPAEVFPHD